MPKIRVPSILTYVKIVWFQCERIIVLSLVYRHMYINRNQELGAEH